MTTAFPVATYPDVKSPASDDPRGTEWQAEYLRLAMREITTLRTENDQAKGYLQRMLSALAPECRPLPDLIGIITQVDNVCSRIKGLEVEVARLEAELVAVKRKLSCLEFNRANPTEDSERSE